ncbi:single-stranded DNA-binding protein [Candidatus Saccharibacteria bacterium]|nr:single-stranded DNA-binding protein [Candidatus Saccharibacteria bacterium]
MRGFSKAIIAGNLTRDPELRTTPNGASVCGFSVAVNRVYKDASGGQREDVSYIDCSAWGKLGEMIAQYAKKGAGVLVSGRLDQRSWEDKNGGGKRSRVEIVVEDFNFTGPANRDGGNSYSNSFSEPAPTDPAPSSAAPDDIPEGDIDLSEVPF